MNWINSLYIIDVHIHDVNGMLGQIILARQHNGGSVFYTIVSLPLPLLRIIISLLIQLIVRDVCQIVCPSISNSSLIQGPPLNPPLDQTIVYNMHEEVPDVPATAASNRTRTNSHVLNRGAGSKHGLWLGSHPEPFTYFTWMWDCVRVVCEWIESHKVN